MRELICISRPRYDSGNHFHFSLSLFFSSFLGSSSEERKKDSGLNNFRWRQSWWQKDVCRMNGADDANTIFLPSLAIKVTNKGHGCVVTMAGKMIDMDWFTPLPKRWEKQNFRGHKLEGSRRPRNGSVFDWPLTQLNVFGIFNSLIFVWLTKMMRKWLIKNGPRAWLLTWLIRYAFGLLGANSPINRLFQLSTLIKIVRPQEIAKWKH